MDNNIVSSFKISNEIGSINRDSEFLLFGIFVSIGSHFDIEFTRTTNIKPAGISIKLAWMELPTSFAIYFQAYPVKNVINNHSFHVDFYLKSGADLHPLNPRPLELFTEDRDGVLKPESIFNLDFDPKWIYGDTYSISMVFVGSEFAFGHKVFRQAYLQETWPLANGQPIPLNLPFTPKVQKLSLSFI